MPLVISNPIARSDFLAVPSSSIDLSRYLPSPTASRSLLLRILTTTLVVHLLLVGFLGAGLPKAQVRPKRTAVPPTVATLLEDVKLQEAPPPEELTKPVDQSQVLPSPELPAASTVDLPPLGEVQSISAVPASVPVAFGLEVTGRVRLVKDAAHASGSVGGRVLTQPVAIDGNSSQEKNLHLPALSYPVDALARQQQGTVVLEFHTSATGEIYEVKVVTGSGFPSIDKAALNNLARGRWAGAPGYFLKTYQFKLN